MARNSSSKGKSKIDGINLEPMEDRGGVIAHTTYKSQRGGQGGGPMHDYETTKTHHPTAEHLMEHIKEHIGHAFSEGEPEKLPQEEKYESD